VRDRANLVGNMSNHEFVSSRNHTFDIEKLREFWNVTLTRIKDYAEAAEGEATGTEDAAEKTIKRVPESETTKLTKIVHESQPTLGSRASGI